MDNSEAWASSPLFRVPVVSIGASAGGVETLREFFEALPSNPGAAFVVIIHLSPDHQSELDKIIAARTDMTVVQVNEPEVLEANKVYVIPPNRRLLMSADRIEALEFEKDDAPRAPIDQFFRSIAEQHGDGFAVILSGAGSDGTVGIKAIKEHGGIILVQDPEEALYASMPRSAIASGIADFVLPVREIALRIADLVQVKLRMPAERLAERDEEAIRRILAQLRLRTGNDFSHYKRATVVRRLARRMQVSRTESLDDYLAYLKDHPEETQLLLADLLISVTSFFRDPMAFEELRRLVIPKLFEERDPHNSLRIWVPGCATGEEVYSIAILLLEEAARREDRPEIQLFASDLDTNALAIAREGSYPIAIEADVSEERLRRFFIRDGDHYRIRREVRDLIVFAPHSLLRDPPFSHIDLISCRNLLIYLDRDLQAEVCGTFHYALRPHGYLFIGSSETVDGHALFRVIHREARIFRAVEGARELPPLPRVVTGLRVPEFPTSPAVGREPRINATAEHRQALEVLSPPSMLVDEGHRILNLSESAGKFLLQPGGPPSNVASDVVRPELRLDLQAGLHRAFEQNEPTVSLPLGVKFNGSSRTVSLHVRPYGSDGGARSALVWFLEGPPMEQMTRDTPPVDEDSSQLVMQLRHELSTAQAHLRTSREQYETVTEELRASNEELQSINEEYRSTAEELETSKEELQSINEELQTLNNELKLKLDVVSRAHNDLQNLMSSTDVSTLFLSTTLRINRFTPRVREIFNVVAGDEGRPISNFTHRLEYGELVQDASRVLDNLVPIERTVRSIDGRWLLVRLRPYRTLDDKIDGVVITFVDVTDRQEAEQKWEARQRLLLDELSHRVKNTLAVVQAIVNLSLQEKNVPREVRENLSARISALARTHDIFVRNDWRSADLAAIIREQLTPHLGEASERLHLEGPAVALPPETATLLTLLIHELATNAMKHGALGHTDGMVHLSWELIEGDKGLRLKILWQERGGPKVDAPTTTGFGSFLMDRGFPEAQVERKFLSDGLVCTIVLPLPKA